MFKRHTNKEEMRDKHRGTDSMWAYKQKKIPFPNTQIRKARTGLALGIHIKVKEMIP